jgi:FHS family L-fucose permease-like MFS transporter
MIVQQRSYFPALSILTFAFFMWGFLTSLNDILVPDLKSIFTLDYTQAMLVQFCFFATYAIMSIPMARLVSRLGYKTSIVIGFIVAGIGCLVFIPAAAVRIYAVFLFGFFVLASGITLLQVAANPYATLLGKPELASRRLTLLQAFNSLGTTIAPAFGSWLILTAAVQTNDQLAKMSASEFTQYQITTAQSIQHPYLLLAAVMVVIGLIIAFLPLPKICSQQQATEHNAEVLADRGSVWRYSHLILGCIAIFVYVGAEVSISSFLVNYFEEPGIANLTPHVAGTYVAYYWGGAMVGRFIGAYLLGKINPPKILMFNAIIAILLLLTTVMMHGHVAMWAVLAIGLFNSVMFPTIFSLAIRGLGRHTPTASGMLCVAIVGGAIVPVIQGFFADRMGVQLSYLVPVICYAFIAYYGYRGYDRAIGLVDVHHPQQDAAA